mmetsp:Transcript_113054/g.319903  ORF Transcript_113054/g.319903 Transcript_113054/m.319903 type:complete len:398 (+) Transcript_113054:74-1267(+)
MPRGPGKKENYNLDYSRFGWLDRSDDDEAADGAVQRSRKSADNAAGPPDNDEADRKEMAEMMGRMPVELQQAYHLMAMARANGDEALEKRATELVLSAVSKGGPEMQQEFMKNVAKQAPDMAKAMNLSPEVLEPEKIFQGLGSQAAKTAPGKEGQMPIEKRMSSLKSQMEKGAEATRQQLENLKKQQEQLERLKTPEDLFKFMHEGGLQSEDLQRIFSGDQSHMEACVNDMLEKAASPGPDGKLPDPEQAIKAVEALHSTICGNLDETSAAKAIEDVRHGAATATQQPQEATSPPRPSKPAEPPKRAVTIPDYRLQYQKDADGRYTAVELKCSLPGVADMSAILLDVSEDHLRLSTCAPAPGYVVNAGPFPVLIDDSAARAKYSKKRQELTITVPAK